MGKVRFLSGAVLLCASCELLWNPFQGPNPDYCEPGSANCPDLPVDGGVDDAAVELDASSTPDGSIPADAATPADLSCNPGPASAWVADPSPPGSAGIALSGVTGNGAGDLWVVGPPAYAAHRATSWNTITLSLLITTVGRVVYAPKQMQAMAIGGSLTGGEVIYLTTSSAPLPDLVTVTPETLSGIWVSPAPESIPYVVGSSGTFQSYANGLIWLSAGASAPQRLNAIAGTGTGTATTIWGASAANNLVTAYAAASNSWRMLTTGASAFNAVSVNANSGVVLVGKNGAIMTAAAAVPPIGPLVAAASPVTAALNDVAATADGKHLFAVGAGGTILHWESVCQRWTVEPSPTTQDLSALWVSDPERMVFAVGNAGTLLHRSIP